MSCGHWPNVAAKPQQGGQQVYTKNAAGYAEVFPPTLDPLESHLVCRPLTVAGG